MRARLSCVAYSGLFCSIDFGLAQEKIAADNEGVVKHLKHPFLSGRNEVDQKIAATDEAEAGERRVLDDVLAGENDPVADALDHPAVIADNLHIAIAKGFGHRLQLADRINCGARPFERIFVQVRAENHVLQPGTLLIVQRILEQHGDAVDFLARRAGRNPAADHILVVLVLDQFADHPRKRQKRLRLAKERGYPYERIAHQKLRFLLIYLQIGDIIRECRDAHDAHAASDAPAHGGAFVIAQLECGIGPHQAVYPRILVSFPVFRELGPYHAAAITADQARVRFLLETG